MSANYSDKRSRLSSQAGKGAIIAIIVILIIIAALAYYFISKKPISLPGERPELGTIMTILPETSAMLFQVNFKNFKDETAKKEMWDKFKNSSQFKEETEKLKTEAGIDFEQDIMTWLGEEVTISFLEIPDEAAGAPEDRDVRKDQFIIAMAAKDDGQARDKLKEIMGKLGDKVKEEAYENAVLWIPSDEKIPVMSVIKGYLIMGSNEQVVKKSVDASNKKTGQLKDNKDIENTLKNLPGNPVGLFYMDMQAAIAANKEAMPVEHPEQEKFQKAMKGIAFGIAEKDGNWIGKGYLGFEKQNDSAVVKAILEAKPSMSIPDAVKLLPKDTDIFNAVDAKVVLDIVIKVLKDLGQDVEYEKMKASMKEETGLDLDADVLDNLSGEVAYSVDLQELINSVMSSQMQPPAQQGSSHRLELQNLAAAIEMWSVDNEGKYPESLEEVTPTYLYQLPEPPLGAQLYYEKSDEDKHFIIGYTSDGESVDYQYPIYDSHSGIMGGMDDSPAAMDKPMPPVLTAVKLKDGAKFTETFTQLIEKMGIPLDASDHQGTKIYKMGDQVSLCVYENFLIMGYGTAARKVETVLNNKMDHELSLASDPGFEKIKENIKPNTLNVSMIKFEKAITMIEGFAPFLVQEPDKKQTFNDVMDTIKKYESVWSFSEIVSDGITMEFIMVKKAK